jgi:hypothetical protein
VVELALSPRRGLRSVVGGRCEDGETAAEMASRKAAEETASFRDLEAGVAPRFVDAAMGEFLAGGLDPGRCRTPRLWLPFLCTNPVDLVEVRPRPQAGEFHLDRGEYAGGDWFPTRWFPLLTG